MTKRIAKGARPGVLYKAPDAPAGYLGYFCVGPDGAAVLRVDVRADRMSDAVWETIAALHELVAPAPDRAAPLALVP